MTNKIIFINLKNNKYTRTRNYYHGFLKLEINCSWYEVAGFGELVNLYRQIKPFRNNTTIVVTSRSQLLSIYSFFLGYRVILDAGLPLWDGVITSRRSFGFMGLSLIKVYINQHYSDNSGIVSIKSDFTILLLTSIYVCKYCYQLS